MLQLEGPVVVAGDWHGNINFALGAIKQAHSMGTSTILHVGDFGYFRPSALNGLEHLLLFLGITIYWIDGNHENHDLLSTLARDEDGLAQTGQNMYHIKRGTVFEVDGVKWLGLGGAASVDRQWRTEGWDWWPGELISNQEAEYACSHGPVHVMLSHDAPHGSEILSLNGRKTSPMWPSIDLVTASQQRDILTDVVKTVKPEVVFHGHWHIRYTEDVSVDSRIVRFEGLDCDGARGYTRNIVLVDSYGNLI